MGNFTTVRNWKIRSINRQRKKRNRQELKSLEDRTAGFSDVKERLVSLWALG